MSSRSLASARSKRTNEIPQRMSGNRPVTSIGSSAAFNQPRPPQNGRQMNNKPPPPPPAVKSDQPFKRLSVSDAVGLITLRLGHLEQWVIETEHESETNGGGEPRLPDNSKIVDNSVFLSMVERITELEKNKQDSERVNTLSKGMTETSMLVKSLIQKYDVFVAETNTKFSDYECAIADLEQQIATSNSNNETFVSETNTKFAEYECAIADLKQQIATSNNETFVAETNSKFAEYECAIADLKQQIATSNNDAVAVVDDADIDDEEAIDEAVIDEEAIDEAGIDDKFPKLDLKNEIEKEFLNKA
ncbi:hypothetical protein N9K75_01405 [bacterium]|nr:hypothetical protein [bacterium]